MAVIGLVMLLVILLSAALADVLFDYETMAVQQNASMRLNPPSSEHLLGTDEVGRDILARIVFGARVSLPVAMATIFFAAIIGGMLGALSGYGSKRLDNFIMRYVSCYPKHTSGDSHRCGNRTQYTEYDDSDSHIQYTSVFKDSTFLCNHHKERGIYRGSEGNRCK